MYQQDNILKELQDLSPTVAGIARINVFTVPAGYFETLSGHILLQLNDAEELGPIKGVAVPEGYFNSLADTIMSRIKKETASDAANETTSISELVAGIGNKNVYAIPQVYFEQLSTVILAQIKNETLSGAVQETNTISPLVAGIGNKNIYSVPQGYFEGFAEQVNLKITTPAKLVSMKSRLAPLKYAAAAVVTGVIGLSIFFMLNKREVNTTAQTAAVMNEANHIIKTNSFDKELESISDAAIVQFLESKGQNVEAALVASLEDEKKLPDADEYLIDENTLDDVLKTLDLNN